LKWKGQNIACFGKRKEMGWLGNYGVQPYTAIDFRLCSYLVGSDTNVEKSLNNRRNKLQDEYGSGKSFKRHG
jgi:hypothetical protein